MFKANTRGVEVTVMPVFMDKSSDPEANAYFWSYRVTIENKSGEPLQLISRYWHITDANGQAEEVRGDGVIGQQPHIPHGGNFTYTSGCPLKTSSGIMVGKYYMKTDSGQMLEFDIPAFSLDLPGAKPVMN